MKRWPIFIVIGVVSLLSCRSVQLSKNNLNKKKQGVVMAQFDKQKFDEIKVNNIAVFNLDDGTQVQLIDNGDTYYEVKSKINDPYRSSLTFYKNLILKGGGTFFYNNPVGVFTEYDEQGNILNQINYDSMYGFTIQNLIDKMNLSYQINLMIPVKNLSVHRFIDSNTNSPYYQIIYPINDQSFRRFKIDGNSGNVISDTIGNYID
jgi:hypothetical protein